VTRSELEHIIRAAASVANDTDLLIIGSQAILGQFPNAPAELLVSMEADVAPRNHPERWDRGTSCRARVRTSPIESLDRLRLAAFYFTVLLSLSRWP
jgi:hypothetical protein